MRRFLIATLLAVLALGTVDTFAAPLSVRQAPGNGTYERRQCFTTVMAEVAGTLGQVLGSRQPGKHIMAAGETVFVATDAELEPGREYLLYRDEGPLDAGSGGRPLGHLVSLLGRVVVLEQRQDRAVARIVASCGEIEAGDRLHELLPMPAMPGDGIAALQPDQLIRPVPADATVVFGSGESLAVRTPHGVVRRGLTPRQTFAAGDVVTVDRGQHQGWQIGDAVILYSDDPRAMAGVDSESGEPVILGQGQVIWLQAETAAVMITHADRTVTLGARARRLVQ